MDRLESVQILRALAALMVLGLHLQGTHAGLAGLPDGTWVPVGSGGVDIFFAISGFIICHAARGDGSAGRFLAHRAARIVPLYWSVTLAIYALALVAPTLLHSTTADPIPLVKSLLFIPYVKDSGLVQPIHMLGWTLNYEVFFYLVFGLGLLVSRSPAALVCAALFGLVGLGWMLPDPGVVVGFFTNSLVLEFVWGCGIYGLYRHAPGVLRALRPVWPLALALLIGQHFVDTGLPRAVSQGIPAALVVAGLLTVRFDPRGWARPLLAIGDASYSLYLLHPLVIRGIDVVLPRLGLETDARIALGLPLMLGLSLGLSVLSFRLFERPTNRWLRRRVARHRRPARTTAP
ncbi:acyltransferase family protein [Roseospira visakhapatnamensis]|uniref:Peptidoglycan/LPS O-acetylase OafA/YrhL n=1 Tax=Roseospira visakhapatnamensis TaxID=390880 RepID=A0A7W6RB24_9PROT|nr:acyltransferase [Roseospira visakhapatnamensis]MBB4265256.1 peptidoglycan/LPS O-acetylase OafA/YrhL [Roseospira visakhapatnamensis]